MATPNTSVYGKSQAASKALTLPLQKIYSTGATPVQPVVAQTPTSTYTAPNQKLPPAAPVQAPVQKPPVMDSGMARDQAAYNALTAEQQQQKLHGTSVPPTTPTTPTPPPTPPAKTIYDMYGIDKTQQPTGSIYDMYGIEQPTKATPDTTKIDQTIKNLTPTGDTTMIDKTLETTLSDIRNRYGLQREDVKRQTQSEFESQLSGLYNAGVVNPLSSGTGSISSASKDILDRRMANLDAAQAAEESAARAVAEKQKTDAQDKALKFATDERARIENQAQKQYEYERQQMSDKVDMINNVVNAWKSGQSVERQNREDAQTNVMDLIGKFGSSAFEGMDAAKVGEIEKATGYPEGSLLKGIAELKKKEIIDGREKLNLHSVGGSLYSITRDANGAVKAELIVQGKAKGGGSNSSNKPKAPKFEDWLKDKESEDNISYNIGNPDVMGDLIAQYNAETGTGKSNLISKALKDYKANSGKSEYTYTTRNIDGTMYELQKDKNGKIISMNPVNVEATTEDTGSMDTGSSDAEIQARKALGLD